MKTTQEIILMIEDELERLNREHSYLDYNDSFARDELAEIRCTESVYYRIREWILENDKKEENE